MASLTIARVDRNTPPIITLEGVLNTNTVGPCMERIMERVDGPFVLDLSRVYACDPGGVSALVELSGKSGRLGARCIVAAPSYAVARVLRTTGMGKHLTICPTTTIARRRLAVTPTPAPPL